MSVQPVPGNAGWLDDPTGRFDKRYWDGAQWTQAVWRGTEVESDPEPPPTAPMITAPAPQNAPRTPNGGPPAASTDRLTSVSPNEAQERIFYQLTAMGLRPQRVTRDRIDFVLVTKKQPNTIVLVVLLLFWIIPGILYWMTASGSKKHGATLYFIPNGSGTRVSMQGDQQAFQALAPALVQLPW